MTNISCQPKYALFIKKKSHTEVNIRNGMDAYNKIRKIQSFYSKENKNGMFQIQVLLTLLTISMSWIYNLIWTNIILKKYHFAIKLTSTTQTISMKSN